MIAKTWGQSLAATATLLIVFPLGAISPHELYLRAMEMDPSDRFGEVLTLALQGYRPAQFEVSEYYTHGEGTAVDEREAEYWLVRAVGPDSAESQYRLGNNYLLGEGIEQNSRRAAFWLQEAAHRGHPGAQNVLAGLFKRGDGVEADAEQGREWLETAARRGSRLAQYRLAMELGMPEGRDWLTRAARGGYAPAQRMLGVEHSVGGALARDDALARDWLQKAADQDDGRAQLLLGLFFQFGRGGSTDLEEAYYWLKRAELNGESAATEQLTSFEDQIETPGQVMQTARALTSSMADPVPFAEDGRVLPIDTQLGFGHGFHITSELILTNWHVVDSCAEVRDAAKRAYAIIAHDRQLDVALLRAPEPSRVWLPLAASTPAIESAVKVAGHVLAGSVKAHQRPGFDSRFLRFDGRVDEGDSGRPLLTNFADSAGDVGGIVVAKLTPGAAYDLTGQAGEPASFALRPELIRAFLDVYGYWSSAENRASSVQDPEDAVRRLECWY